VFGRATPRWCPSGRTTNPRGCGKRRWRRLSFMWTW
jgi:hypothetical protein